MTPWDARVVHYHGCCPFRASPTRRSRELRLCVTDPPSTVPDRQILLARPSFRIIFEGDETFRYSEAG